MMKEEFMAELRKIGYGANVSDDEYREIEYVYTWHPSICDVGGKAQIAALYAHGGILVIRDMAARAKKAESMDGKMREIRRDIEGMQKQLEDMRREILS